MGDKSKDENDNEEKDLDSGRDSPLDMNFFGLLKNSAGWDKKFGVQKLTLANLLEVLDGVMEMEGRMLIITTNYPEKLDKALIRPGRIDMKVHFGPMTSKNIMEMFQYYFETEVPSDFDISLLPEMKWTPAEVTQVFLNNMHNPRESLRQLTSDDSLQNIHLRAK